MQLLHHQHTIQKKAFPVRLVLDGVYGEANIGSIFRLADAFHIEKIIFCGVQPNLNSSRLRKTSRSTHKYISHEYAEDIQELLQKERLKGYTVIGLEIVENSIPLDQVKIGPSEKIVLIAGHEKTGISAQVLKLCDQVVHISMFGNNSSMNVAQAIGISLYEITKNLTA